MPQACLYSLPLELKTWIFIYSQTPAVSLVSRSFHQISQLTIVRAHYLVYEYGKLEALSMLASRRTRIFTDKVVEYLVAFGCDVSVDSCWIIARYAHRPALLTKLIKSLYYGGKAKILELLGIVDATGSTHLLHMLAHTYAVNVNVADEVLLRAACKSNRASVVHYLVNNTPCNIHVFHDLPLCLAALNGHVEIVQVLLDHGAHVQAEGNAALTLAVIKNHVHVVRLLLTSGADVHVDADSPLRHASEFGYTEIVQLLLSFGAQPSSLNHDALRQALMNGHTEVVGVLLKHGADPRVCVGRCARIALCKGHEETLQLVRKAVHLQS